jgi:hypothetical protein
MGSQQPITAGPRPWESRLQLHIFLERHCDLKVTIFNLPWNYLSATDEATRLGYLGNCKSHYLLCWNQPFAEPHTVVYICHRHTHPDHPSCHRVQLFVAHINLCRSKRREMLLVSPLHESYSLVTHPIITASGIAPLGHPHRHLPRHLVPHRLQCLRCRLPRSRLHRRFPSQFWEQDRAIASSKSQ